MAKTSKLVGLNSDFDSILNECMTYVWEWNVNEKYVKFGIPSLDGSWHDDKNKIFKLETVLEKVHPDDVAKIFTQRNSVLYYKSDKMFEIDLRINADGRGFEWFGFRGRILQRNEDGKAAFLHGVAINLNKRIEIQQKLQRRREHLFENERQKTDYCAGVMQEVVNFIRNAAQMADAFIANVEAPTDLLSKESRRAQFSEVKNQCEHILDLVDKVKQHLGQDNVMADEEVHSLALWEHLAEYQQIYALKARGAAKIYFSNLYDDLRLVVNVRLLDLLVENVINSQLLNSQGGNITINYHQDLESESVVIAISSGNLSDFYASSETLIKEKSLGLSVCRLLATRMMGDVKLERTSNQTITFIITLPIDVTIAKRSKSNVSPIKLYVEGETVEPYEEVSKGKTIGDADGAQIARLGVHVALGISETGQQMLEGQHLFEVSKAPSTQELLSLVRETNPDIVFLDYNLQGTLSSFELIDAIKRERPETPVIVTSDYAHRVLHRQVKALGARYLITNPLTIRKVNTMIKRYLK